MTAVDEAPARAAETDVCAACRTRQPLAEMERVPTRPYLMRCADADACRERYTPRRLTRQGRRHEAAGAPGEQAVHFRGLAGAESACRWSWPDPGGLKLTEKLREVTCGKCRRSRGYQDAVADGSRG